MGVTCKGTNGNTKVQETKVQLSRRRKGRKKGISTKKKCVFVLLVDIRDYELAQR